MGVSNKNLMGAPKYITRIALPSVIGYHAIPDNKKLYYSQPWERSADFFGGVDKEDYYPGSGILSVPYLIMP